MKRNWVLFLALLTIAMPGVVGAEMCTLDPQPAATLLLPYFEVDIQDPGGITTLFTVNNDLPEPALAHITLWSDWGRPTVDFDIFLTGYDVVPINLYDVFQGRVPITADLQSDPEDTVSPHGFNPEWDGSFPNCQTFFPFPDPVISGAFLTRLRNGHTGRDILGQGCLGEDHGDDIARGYITIDNVSRCSVVFPNEEEFFAAGPDRVASDKNQLWGQYFVVDQRNDSATGEALVAIEADPEFDASSTATGYTFYGRYHPGGVDHREPLATSWRAPYVTNGAFDGGTELLVWRDSTAFEPGAFLTCGVGPSALPLQEVEVVVFDEEESVVEICVGSPLQDPPDPNGDPRCAPLETQRLKIGEGNLAIPYESGWISLNLNVFDDGEFDVDFGGEGSLGSLAQSHVSVVSSALGRFQVGFAAQPRASACEDVSLVVNSIAGVPIF